MQKPPTRDRQAGIVKRRRDGLAPNGMPYLFAVLTDLLHPAPPRRAGVGPPRIVGALARQGVDDANALTAVARPPAPTPRGPTAPRPCPSSRSNQCGARPSTS